jgi:hypothetical protein
MKKLLLLSIYLITLVGHAQEPQKSNDLPKKAKRFISTFNLAIPVIENQESEKQCYNADGVIFRSGAGLVIYKWIGAEVNAGVDWSNSNCIVIVPVFGSLRVSPKISDDTHIILDYGRGRSLTLGDSHLAGNFQKFSLGLASDRFGIYAEVNDYGFSNKNTNHLVSLAFGLSYSL